MLRIQNLKLPIAYTKQDLVRACEKALHRSGLPEVRILKRSLDSRRKDRIHYHVSAGVWGFSEAEEKKILRFVNNNNVMLTEERKYRFPLTVSGKEQTENASPESPEGEYISGFRPVIIGTGPAGYFAGYVLASAGYRPILLERGKAVEDRAKDVEHFWEGGPLNPESNVSFGEGGAGTFSDGKLYTGNKDKDGSQQFVLDTFHRFGAPEEITYDAKPHIGTDILYRIMQNMRQAILDAEGEIHFSHHVTEIREETGGYNIRGLRSDGDPSGSGEDFLFHASAVILAIGHSARDTFAMLSQNGLSMEKKPFAVGLRIEHPRDLIDRDRYGDLAGRLPAADYKLVAHTSEDRAVFSFCMCPGGYVVNASTEEGGTVVNGMSYSGRSGRNSNSAIVVNILPSDIPGDSPMDAVAYQRSLEQAFYRAGGGQVPVQRYGDFCMDRKGDLSGSVEPCIKGKYQPANLRECLPASLSRAIIEAMPVFDRQIHGFAMDDAVLSGIESRTSSPVRILRDENLQAQGHPGFFPCGEGAGYAGGIMSAAVDGIHVAEKVAEYIHRLKGTI